MNTLNHPELCAVLGGGEVRNDPPPPTKPRPYTPPPPPPVVDVYAAPGIDPTSGIDLAR